MLVRGYSEMIEDCAEQFAIEKGEEVKIEKKALYKRINTFKVYTSFCSTPSETTKTRL